MRKTGLALSLAVVAFTASCMGGLERNPLPNTGGSGGGSPPQPDGGSPAQPDAETDSGSPPPPDASPDAPTTTSPPPLVLVEQACGMIGSGGVRAVAYPRADAPFAVAYGAGQVAFFGPSAPEWRGTVAAHYTPIAAMVASVDGSLLATSSGKEIKIWRTADRSLLRTLASPGARVYGGLAFSPDGTSLFSGSMQPTATHLWDVGTGALLWSQPQTGGLTAAFFAPDGQSVVAGADSLSARRVADGSLLQTIPLGARPLQLSPDGSALLAWSSSTGLSLRRLSDLQPLWSYLAPPPYMPGQPLPPPSAPEVLAAAYSPDAAQVAAIVKEGTGSIAVLDARDGRVVRTIDLEARQAVKLAYSPDGRRLVAGFLEGAVRVFNLETGAVEVGEPSTPGHGGAITRTAFSPGGTLVGSHSLDGFDTGLRMWRASDRSLAWARPDLRGTDGSPQSFAFSQDSSLVAIPSGSTISLLRATDGVEVGAIANASASSLAISPDGTLIAAGCSCSGRTPAVRVWRVADGVEQAGFGDGTTQAHTLAFSPDGALLVARSAYPGAHRVAAWRVADQTLLWTDDTAEPVTRSSHISFSADGARVLAMSNIPGGAISVYQSQDGAVVRRLPAERPASGALSPNGSLLAVAVESGLRLWRTSDWSLRGELPGAFTSVAFSPDGETLLTGGTDWVLRFFCLGPDF
jgi:WD40 repeat protein